MHATILLADRVRPGPLRLLACLLVCGVLGACAGSPPSMQEMMPAPAVAGEEAGSVDLPIAEGNTALLDILYATNRAPAGADDEQAFYTNERGYLVRLGSGRIAFGDSDITWDEARKISLLKNRPGEFPLEIRDAAEYGIVPDSVSIFTPRGELDAIDESSDDRFVAAVEERLARSDSKDVFIYVHGYKVEFENPLLVAAEMWHFLGYQGAFVAFSWPSTPSRLAYFKDTETARVAAWGLRQLITYLARETSVERINIIGYSAGTRLVLTAMHELALIHQQSTPDEIVAANRLGRVILVGSDVDSGTFASYVLDGLLRVQDQLNLYVSPADKALKVSDKVLRHRRLGQVLPGTLDERMREFVMSTDRLHFVDVEDADQFDEGNG
ncbi:MAG: alpha/beta hydrolase, partial [Gammaproteobacteria bacterium]